MHLNSFKLLGAFFLLFLTSTYGQPALTLNQYTAQVIKSNPKYKSLHYLQSSLENATEKANLLFTPHLYAKIADYDTYPLTKIPLYNHLNVNTSTFQTGLAQKYMFGVQTTLGIEAIRTRNNNINLPIDVSPLFQPVQDSTSAVLELSIKQDLWSNFLGKITKKQYQSTIDEIESNQYNNQYRINILLISIKNAYSQLAMQQQIVRIKEKTLQHYEALLNTYQQKKTQQLITEELLLNLEIKVNSQKLSLENDVVTLKQEEKFFNQLRNKKDNKHIPTLIFPNLAEIKKLKTPPYNKGNLKSKHLRLEYEAEKLSAEAKNDETKPHLTLSGRYSQPLSSYSNNGTEDNTFKGWDVSLKLTSPIISQTFKKSNQSTLDQLSSMKLLYESNSQDARDKWYMKRDLFNESKKTLYLILSIEKSQKTECDKLKELSNKGVISSESFINCISKLQSIKTNRLNTTLSILHYYDQIQLNNT